MKIYISGPITGMPDGNKAAKAALAAAGFEPVSPFDNGVPAGATWETHMRADIAIMLDCNAVCLLEGWSKSRGARIEATLAVGMNIPCRSLDEWLWLAHRSESAHELLTYRPLYNVVSGARYHEGTFITLR